MHLAIFEAPFVAPAIFEDTSAVPLQLAILELSLQLSPICHSQSAFTVTLTSCIESALIYFWGCPKDSHGQPQEEAASHRGSNHLHGGAVGCGQLCAESGEEGASGGVQGEAQALTRQGEAKTLAGHAEEAAGEAHHVGEEGAMNCV